MIYTSPASPAFPSGPPKLPVGLTETLQAALLSLRWKKVVKNDMP